MAMSGVRVERTSKPSSIPTKTGEDPAKEVTGITTYGGVKSFKTS